MEPSPKTPLLEATRLCKSYGSKAVLQDLSLTIYPGEFVAVVGKSGCGKSTLLNLLGLSDAPDQGEIILFGKRNPKCRSRTSRLLLRDQICYVFQNFGLLEDKSAAYNLKLVMPHPFSRKNSGRIASALEQVGLQGYENKKIAECSGGEQQRIAISRVLVKPCSLILADEPTANLDPENKRSIGEIFRRLTKTGKSIVMVTHDPAMAEMADRIIRMEDINRSSDQM